MDNKDFFGYNRKVTAPGTALPAEFATLTLGDDAAAVLLLQSAQISYAHTVQPFFEIGSANLYWVTGQPMGSAQIGRVVGQEGFLQKFGKGTACAQIQSLSLGLKESGSCVEVKAAGKGVNLLNCMPEAITITVQAGALQMQEGMSIRVGTLQAA
jgi:hypothetical protein